MKQQNSNMNQKQLFYWINQISFVLNDVLLYLDTHPCDKEAMEFYEHFNKMRQEALEEYAENYSPITLDSANNCQKRWKWATDRWPWEGGNC